MTGNNDAADQLREAAVMARRRHFLSPVMLERELSIGKGDALHLLRALQAAGVVGEPDEDGRWWSLADDGLTRAAKEKAVAEMAHRFGSAVADYERARGTALIEHYARTLRRRHAVLVRLAMARTVD